jgi:membrane-bound ClpP family serine protease
MFPCPPAIAIRIDVQPIEAADETRAASGRTIISMTALGVSLLVIGAIVVVVEAHVPTLGALGGPGVVALAAGSVLAVSGLGGGIVVGVLSALVLVAISVGVLTVSLRKGIAARRRRISAGPEGLIGHVGVVRSWSEPTGKVLVDGALWQARRSPGVEDEGPYDLHTGDPIVVERLSGLTLAVRPAEDWELAQ